MIVIFTNLSSVAPPRSLSLASYGTSANNISVKVIYNLNPTNINVSHFNIILNCEGILPSSSVSSVPMSRGNLCFISQLFNFSFSSLDISLAITVVLINFEEHKFNHTISIYKLCFYTLVPAGSSSGNLPVHIHLFRLGGVADKGQGLEHACHQTPFFQGAF